MVYHQKDSLGQNFIKYKGLVSELIAEADISDKDTVIEIGPGKGIITQALIKTANKVVAIEKDELLVAELIKKFEGVKNLEIVGGDILTTSLPESEYKIFSNIPFSITSEIMAHVLQSKVLPTSMYLIMQQETAEKFSGARCESLSSVLTKPFFEVKILGEIDRTNFTLKPQVHIMFTSFKRREHPFIKEEDKKLFRDFVSYGFTKWQPTVMESYKKVMTFDQIKNIKKMLKIGEVKPSELSFDKWLLLFKAWEKIANQKQRKEVTR
ncbi:MAG: 23S ribosomal RNA methyltransferase Erm [Candidatus Shapirobacteria bacterium]|jgi:23S rRNA (adenine-N6)-dimethyltransferase